MILTIYILAWALLVMTTKIMKIHEVFDQLRSGGVPMSYAMASPEESRARLLYGFDVEGKRRG